MLEFSRSEEPGPLVRVIGAEDLKISLDFLIGSFSLSISLGVVCSGQANIIFKDPGKLSG